MVAYLSFFVTSTTALLAEARKGDVILATTDPPMISVAGGLVATLRSAKLVNWLQDIFPEVAVALEVKGMAAFVAKGLTSLRNWSLRCAKANVAIGQVMATRIGSVLSGKCAPVVIENWALDADLDLVPSGPEDFRVAWGLSDRFIVGYSGNLGRVHSWEPLFAAAEQLAHRQDIQFLFIGGGAGMRSLINSVAAAGLGNVKFLGYQPRESLSQTLRVPDVHIVSLKPALKGYVVPSKLYGVLAAARPVLFVGKTDGEVGTVIAKSGCGFAIEEHDVAGLAQAICLLAADPEEARRMGRMGRDYLDAHHAKQGALAAWHSTLQRALG